MIVSPDSRQHGDGALISRNTFRRRSFITLKCPEGYLFTNLKFKLDPTADKGSSKCDRRGTEARRRCRWRQTCRVDTNLRGCNAAHMQLSNFKCIPQGGHFFSLVKGSRTPGIIHSLSSKTLLKDVIYFLSCHKEPL